MRMTRIFVEQPLRVRDRLTLADAASTHLLRVLRAGVGDACVLFNGDGHDYDARIAAVDKRAALVDVLSARPLGNESPLRVTLLQALARGDKMDWILQKATELGVAAITPVASERSEVKLDGERGARRVSHWQGVVVAACEQSGRATVPEIAGVLALDAALPGLPAQARRLLLDPEATLSLRDLQIAPDSALVLAIGPEGGWSPRDRSWLDAAGFIAVRLGPRVLRSETAGPAAIAAVQALFGDFG